VCLSWVRIPPGCKVFRTFKHCNAVFQLSLQFYCVYLSEINVKQYFLNKVLWEAKAILSIWISTIRFGRKTSIGPLFFLRILVLGLAPSCNHHLVARIARFVLLQLTKRERYTFARPSKIYPNWDFWFENMPSGNTACGTSNDVTASHTSNGYSFRWRRIPPF
jgi:hypothetical protein